jgi:hypothetical protein
MHTSLSLHLNQSQAKPSHTRPTSRSPSPTHTHTHTHLLVIVRGVLVVVEDVPARGELRVAEKAHADPHLHAALGVEVDRALPHHLVPGQAQHVAEAPRLFVCRAWCRSSCQAVVAIQIHPFLNHHSLMDHPSPCPSFLPSFLSCHPCFGSPGARWRRRRWRAPAGSPVP